MTGMDFDFTDEDLEIYAAAEDLQLIEQGNLCADDLTQFVIDEEYHSTVRVTAAKKLLEMWNNGRVGGITLDHLAYVGDHANEPYKSQANQIIKDNI